MWKLQYQKGGTNEELRGDPLHDSIETEEQNKIGNPKKCKETYDMNFLTGYRNSGRIWLM